MANVVVETSASVTIDVDMQTAGLVVLSDRWANGWRAFLDGRELPIVKANYALRGVEVPAGKGTLEFRYEPRTFYYGLWYACGAAAVLMILGTLNAMKRRGQTEETAAEAHQMAGAAT